MSTVKCFFMYLKKLELHGFKSFASTAMLEFEHGISAIVGPNGSGKSNVADALRFVLGEQSMKSVRSKKMEDLIFSGSASKPRMNMASVAIHFDNSDKAFPLEFDSVVIRRKVFRDGENQYFINDAHVRLKDLAELIAKAHLEQKLKELESQYLHKQVRALERKEQQLEKEASAGQDARVRLQIELARVAKEIESNQGAIENAFGDVAKFEQALLALEEERNDLSREIGKVEGMLALSGKNRSEDARVAAVTMAYVKEKLEALNLLLEEFKQCSTYEMLHQKSSHFMKQFGAVLRDIRENKISTAMCSETGPEPIAPASDVGELEKRRKELQELLCLSDEKLRSAKEEIRKINAW